MRVSLRQVLTGAGSRGLIVALALLVLPGRAVGQQAAPAAPGAPQAPVTLGDVRIDRFLDLQWRPETNYFRSAGPVRITFTDAESGERTVLLADDAEGSPTEQIRVRGALRMYGREGMLSGRDMTFHPTERTGVLSSARAHVGGLVIVGDRIEILPGGTMHATGASFTTCAGPRPHYRVTARSLRVTPAGRVVARNVALWLGGAPVLAFPVLERTFRRTVTGAFPLPTYSKEDGIQLRFRGEPVEAPGAAMVYDVKVSARRVPQGLLAWEADLGAAPRNGLPPRPQEEVGRYPLSSPLVENPALLAGAEVQRVMPRRATVYALVSSRLATETRSRTDLRVSRLPEVGIRLRNATNVSLEEEGGGWQTSPSASHLFSPSDFLVNASLSLGLVQERPTRAGAGRLSLQLEAVSPMIGIGDRMRFRYGVAGWLNGYGTGDGYALIAPEAEVSVLISRSAALGVAYRYQQAAGRSPFVFDRRDVRHEMRLRYAYVGSRWGYDLNVHYDMERWRAFDTRISARRRFDCLEIGLAYTTRAQSLGLILNLLPGVAPAPDPEAIGP
ncbi:MAG TPA: hypothetical protein VLH79_10495 [Chthonomonadales bacterium]|nr:hypothetical protein [Chthonomonadales bacterium]